MSNDQSKDEWLAVRLAEAKNIDPEAAEIDFVWGQIADPYGLDRARQRAQWALVSEQRPG
jgi:hypothetical protein